jgi:hypothetical protein
VRPSTTFQRFIQDIPLVKYMYSSKQITSSPIKEGFANLNNYEILARTNFSLKKYLDFHRYIFAKNV